jgi:hypothetical protein
MQSIVLLAPALITILVSMLIVRAGAVALVMTGMSYEMAKFQALSAFSGTGFTTREAERVVNNPRRRKIITWLMVLGNAGIVTVIVTATSSFSQADGLVAMTSNLLLLISGASTVWFLVIYTGVIKRWESYVHRRLSDYTENEADLTPEELFHLSEGYGVLRFKITDGCLLIGQGFTDISNQLDNASVLGVERGGDWISKHHHSQLQLQAGDLVVVYGRLVEMHEKIKGIINLSR